MEIVFKILVCIQKTGTGRESFMGKTAFLHFIKNASIINRHHNIYFE